jgi:hypothetical protein
MQKRLQSGTNEYTPEFSRFLKVGREQTLEKDGVTITFDRPVLSKVAIDPKAKTGEVVFFLDEDDDRRLNEF